MKKVIVKSEAETLVLGQEIGVACSGGEVFALYGDLGAGKTVLAKGLAKGLGIKERVNSPTFNIFKLYKIKGSKQIKYFCHVDAYRLKSEKDLLAIGILDYLAQPETVVLIEWAERIEKILPKKTKKIFIEHLKGVGRSIKM